MVVAISREVLTLEDVSKINVLEVTYHNCIKNSPKEFTDTMVLDLINGIINEAISRAESEQIHADWSNFQFSSLFQGIYRHVMMNLYHAPDKTLYENVITNQIPCDIVARIDIFQKQPKRWEEIRKHLTDKENESLSKIALTSDKTCGKCKKRTVIYTSVQTRSADEPETQKYECLNCNNKWKVCM